MRQGDEVSNSRGRATVQRLSQTGKKQHISHIDRGCPGFVLCDQVKHYKYPGGVEHVARDKAGK